MTRTHGDGSSKLDRAQKLLINVMTVEMQRMM